MPPSARATETDPAPSSLPRIRSLTRDGPLLVSIHIPKAAGSHLAAILARHYGKRLALYYGPDDPRTHPLARRPSHQFDATMAKDLEAAGVAVLHGHFPARHALAAVPDPSRYRVVLREPVERTISHYHFLLRHAGPENALAGAIRDGALSVSEFAALDRVRTFQKRYVAPLSLTEANFAGVVEMLPLLLPTLGLGDLARRGNVNAQKPVIDPETRRAVAEPLADEMALYSEAMALSMDRLSARDSRASAVYRLTRWLPQRGAAAARPPHKSGDRSAG